MHIQLLMKCCLVYTCQVGTLRRPSMLLCKKLSLMLLDTLALSAFACCYSLNSHKHAHAAAWHQTMLFVTKKANGHPVSVVHVVLMVQQAAGGVHAWVYKLAQENLVCLSISASCVSCRVPAQGLLFFFPEQDLWWDGAGGAALASEPLSLAHHHP